MFIVMKGHHFNIMKKQSKLLIFIWWYIKTIFPAKSVLHLPFLHTPFVECLFYSLYSKFSPIFLLTFSIIFFKGVALSKYRKSYNFFCEKSTFTTILSYESALKMKCCKLFLLMTKSVGKFKVMYPYSHPYFLFLTLPA